MKPWEEFDQPLSTIHHEADVEDVNDYSEYYMNENPDDLYEVDGEFFNDYDHYNFTMGQREIDRYNEQVKNKKELDADV